MVNSLYLDPHFFFKKTGQKIQPEDLDAAFNNIVSYINTILIPVIEDINFTATKGQGGSPFAVFCNITNQDVGYLYIQDLNIDDNLISLDKIEKIIPGSILGSTPEGKIFAITPTESNQLLFIGALDENDIFADQNNMGFRKIQSSDILPNTFTGQQLGILNANNFVLLNFTDLIPDNSINVGMLQPTIQAIKIADKAVDFNSLGEWPLVALPFPGYLASSIELNDFDDSSILPSNLANYSIPWSAISDPYPIKGINLLKDQVYNDTLYPYNENIQPISQNPTRAQLIGQKNWGAIINFPQAKIYNDMHLPSQKIKHDSLEITNFSADIQKAMNNIINPPPAPAPIPPQPVAPNPVYIPIQAVAVFPAAVVLGNFALVKAPNVSQINFNNTTLERYWWYYREVGTDRWKYLPTVLAVGQGQIIPGYGCNLNALGLMDTYLNGPLRYSLQNPPFIEWNITSGTPIYG